jgi:hypothetical protein
VRFVNFPQGCGVRFELTTFGLCFVAMNLSMARFGTKTAGTTAGANEMANRTTINVENMRTQLEFEYRKPLLIDLLATLKREIVGKTDPDDKRVSEHMVMVMAAVCFGTDVDRLANYTGYSKTLIESVSIRMRTAELWIGEFIDDREWWDTDPIPIRGIFNHALVAQGDVIRASRTDGGCTYLDAETGEVSGEWTPLQGDREKSRYSQCCEDVQLKRCRKVQ